MNLLTETKHKFLGLPGTGKTTAIVNQINELTGEIRLRDMIICTFRKNAAQDLARAVQTVTGYEDIDKLPYLNTIHGVCYRILDLKKDHVLQSKDINEFCNSMGIKNKSNKLDWTDTADEAPPGQDMFNFYTWMKNTRTPMKRWAMYPEFNKLNISPSTIRYFVEQYEEFKNKCGKLDFTDMIDRVIENGYTPPYVKALIVDEFQDLTPQQFEVVKMWNDAIDTTIVAGDPFQSIYGFWGGTPDHFNAFDAETTILPITHRLPQQTWDIAQKILTSKKMDVPDIECKKDGTNISFINVAQSEQLMKTYASDTMHLVRANFQAVPISYKLAEYGIIFDGLNGWTDSEINLYNAIALMRTKQPITAGQLIELIKSFPANVFKSEKKTLIKSIEDKPQRLFNIPSIYELTNDKNSSGLRLFDIIAAHDPTVYMQSIGNLKKAKISNALKFNRGIININKLGITKLLTIHGAKGLEADIVFLHTGITTRIKKEQFTASKAAEEARVFFVGATRNKEKLFVVNDPVGDNYFIPKGA